MRLPSRALSGEADDGLNAIARASAPVNRWRRGSRFALASVRTVGRQGASPAFYLAIVAFQDFTVELLVTSDHSVDGEIAEIALASGLT